MPAASVLFDQWRSTRRQKGRIPEGLWEAAVELFPVILDLPDFQRTQIGLQGTQAKDCEFSVRLRVSGLAKML